MFPKCFIQKTCFIQNVLSKMFYPKMFYPKDFHMFSPKCFVQKVLSKMFFPKYFIQNVLSKNALSKIFYPKHFIKNVLHKMFYPKCFIQNNSSNRFHFIPSFSSCPFFPSFPFLCFHFLSFPLLFESINSLYSLLIQ